MGVGGEFGGIGGYQIGGPTNSYVEALTSM